MYERKRPDVLGRDKRTGRKGVLGKPRASQRAKSTGAQRHSGGAGYPGGAGRSNRGATFFMTSLFTGKGRYPKLITILLIMVVTFSVFAKLGGKSLFRTQTSTWRTGQTSTDNGAYTPDMSVSELSRSKRTVLLGDGKDIVTVMVYMCGADLEANYQMASSDIQEMIASDIGDNVNIIIETGGVLYWKNNNISNKTNQRYKVTSDGLKLLQDGPGERSMVEASTLSDFIEYCKDTYPADRYALIFWGHGGGSVGGYGYDQHFPGNSMTLDEMGAALKKGNCEFDFIGFDASLMATLETALVLEPYADYMIASQEVEPGIGWYYTGWISALSDNTSISTVELGKKLIDDYINEVKEKAPSIQATLSLIDLAELKGTVPSTFSAFAKSTGELIDNGEYKYISNARASTKEFSPQAKLHLIDLIHFTENMGTAEAEALSEALRGCIKYNRSSINITNSNGISLFFPYGATLRMNSVLSTYDKIGIDKEFSRCIKIFSSMAVGGQVNSWDSNNLLSPLSGGLTGGNQAPVNLGSLGYSWLDKERIKASQDYYEQNRIDRSALVITQKNGQRVLALPDNQRELIQEMEMNVFLDDTEGFIELGLNNVYEYKDDGDLIMEYDGKWLGINGQIVSYYMISEDRDAQGNYSIRGRVPAFLNDRLVDIIVVFDNENPDGTVLGAQIKYEPETETGTLHKGLIDIEAGDKIDFLCGYYTYDGEYIDRCILGEQYTATGDWKVEKLSIAGMKYKMAYRITDIYGNYYWTQSISG